MAKLKLSEFVLVLILVYGSFMVGGLISKAVGFESWGLVGTAIIWILPVAIIYYVWKRWLQKAVN